MWTKPRPNYCWGRCGRIAPDGYSLCPECKERENAKLRAIGISPLGDYQKEIKKEFETSGYYNVSGVVAMTGLCAATIWKRRKLLNLEYKVVRHSALFSEEVVEIISSFVQDGYGACYSDGRLFITTGKLAEHIDCVGRRQINKLGKDGRWERFIMSGMVWNEAHGFRDYLTATRHPEAAERLHQDIGRLCLVIDAPVTSVHLSSSPQILATGSQNNDTDNEGKNRPGQLSWLDY